ncbi:MAG: hypothetical protein CFK52_09260 [Chloracidobacterium sp. CP2_5A]|nr:MAG: hypothetical protein CFK52_09260 [Chloracidobacterium sp. CP2_5A]
MPFFRPAQTPQPKPFPRRQGAKQGAASGRAQPLSLRGALRRLAIIALALALVSSAPAQRRAVPPKVAAALAETNAILRDVARLRELPIRRPVKSGYRSRKEVEQFVIQDFESSQTPEELAAQSKMLVALALIPKDYSLREEMIRLLTEQIAGFYQPKTGEFVLTESLVSDDPDSQRIAIAHELTHALQDQHFDLRRFEKPAKGNSDRDVAARALIEGDATVAMLAYAFDGRLDIRKMPLSIGALLETSGALSEDPKKTPALVAAPKALKQLLLFPYAGGADFVQALLRDGGWARVSRAFTDLPESTEQILHPEKYFARERPVAVALPDLTDALGDDWRFVTDDVQGELGYRLILGKFIDEKRAKQAAQGWGGDRSALYERRSTGQLCLIQSTRWDAAAAAQAFFSAYAERTQRRFPRQDFDRSQADLMAGEGVYIERRGAKVFILEGLPSGADARAIVERLSKRDDHRRNF